MKYAKFYAFALAIILIDQAVKFWVHDNMAMGTSGEILVFGDWFKLHYTLNPGMAFGLQIGSKVFLTVFRLISTVAITWYIAYLINTKAPIGFIWCMAAILGGAIGNVVDSTFYGIWLENAQYMENPPFFYPLFYGQVVDMFYLDIWKGHLPENIPLIGGDYYAFWPIFNVADSAIFLGVATILVKQKTFLAVTTPNNPAPAVETPTLTTPTEEA